MCDKRTVFSRRKKGYFDRASGLSGMRLLGKTMAVLEQIAQILSGFAPITLEEMKDIRLMNRTDTKYVVPVAVLVPLLEAAREDYRVQEVDGERNIAYRTVYYDTADQKMYIAHQNGKKTREKIRMRTYVSSGLSFLEVKNKNNRGRTDKKRIKVDADSDYMHSEETRFFLAKHARYSPDELVPHIENQFNRITLVNRGMTERLTMDTGLCFHNYSNDRNGSLTGIAVVELKRDGRTPSPMHDLLIRMHIHTMGFSKYCIGCAFTDPTLKQNLFKERIRRVLKLNEVSHV